MSCGSVSPCCAGPVNAMPMSPMPGACGAEPVSPCGGAGGGVDLLTKIKELLQKVGGGGTLAQGELEDIVKKLQMMGPEGIKQILQQSPQFTQMLAKAV